MSNERGFTIVEVLVALAIFSLAAIALLRLEGATLANSAALEDHAIAQMVARNVAVETLTDPMAPSLGLSSGAETNAGRQWRWSRRTSLAAEADLQRIEIAVSGESGQTLASLIVFRSTI
jgi:general secretion pathway protein I